MTKPYQAAHQARAQILHQNQGRTAGGMMKRSWLHLSSLLWITVGCSGTSGSTRATEEDYDDVAQALSSVVVTTDQGGETGSFFDAMQIVVGTPSLGFVVNAAGRIAGKRAELSYAYSATCKNADAEVLPSCDLTTDAATVQVDWSGELTTPNFTASIEHQAELRLLGIQSGTVSISGDGSSEFDAHFESASGHVARDYHFGYNVTYSGIQVQRFPLFILEGSLHFTIDAKRMKSVDSKQTASSLRIDGDLEFAADGSANLTLDATRQYTINMISGAVVRRED